MWIHNNTNNRIRWFVDMSHSMMLFIHLYLFLGICFSFFFSTELYTHNVFESKQLVQSNMFIEIENINLLGQNKKAGRDYARCKVKRQRTEEKASLVVIDLFKCCANSWLWSKIHTHSICILNRNHLIELLTIHAMCTFIVRGLRRGTIHSP